ncbi:hypothetical protein [Candidatus Binatus sp.]|uniref:hypothetical protein n=1 Tax=Candidatus Binatus sp. TaxID=2811406 RepID=UPI003C5D4BBC
MFINSEHSSSAHQNICMRRVSALVAMVVVECLFAAACASSVAPPRASFTQTATFDQPPKPDGCYMPVLNTEPLTAHRRIAIVEAWGSSVDQQDQVLEALKSKGCETGADALVIVEGQSQANPHIAQFGLPETVESEEEKMDKTQGQRHKNDIAPAIGEAGHPGYYVDSVAIVYDKTKANGETASH